MPFIAPFLPSIISGAATIGSSLLGSKASRNAANAQVNAQGQAINQSKTGLAEEQGTLARATGDANDILSRSAETQIGMHAPYVEAGQHSLQDLLKLAGEGGALDQKFSFDPKDLQNDPGYAFTLQQGQKALQQAAAAKGGLFSSGTLKSLAGYATGTADQYFNSAFGRALQTFDTNRNTALSRFGSLQNIANFGMSGTNADANAVSSTSAQQAQNVFGGGEFNANLAQHTSDQIGKYLTGQGDSKAAGIVGSTNSILGGIQNGTKVLQDFLAGRKSSPGGAPNTSNLPVDNRTGVLNPFPGGYAPDYSSYDEG